VAEKAEGLCKVLQSEFSHNQSVVRLTDIKVTHCGSAEKLSKHDPPSPKVRLLWIFDQVQTEHLNFSMLLKKY
jgi:hypothetical protein